MENEPAPRHPDPNAPATCGDIEPAGSVHDAGGNFTNPAGSTISFTSDDDPANPIELGKITDEQLVDATAAQGEGVPMKIYNFHDVFPPITELRYEPAQEPIRLRLASRIAAGMFAAGSDVGVADRALDCADQLVKFYEERYPAENEAMQPGVTYTIPAGTKIDAHGFGDGWRLLAEQLLGELCTCADDAVSPVSLCSACQRHQSLEAEARELYIAWAEKQTEDKE